MGWLAAALAFLCAYLVFVVLWTGEQNGLSFLYALACFGSTWVANGFVTAPPRAKV